MSYALQAFGWGQPVFALPAALVDEYIKLASGNQTKVLLVILRHAPSQLSTDQLAALCGLPCGEVEDALTYWQQMGVLTIMSSDAAEQKDLTEQKPTMPFAPSDFSMTVHAQPEQPPQVEEERKAWPGKPTIKEAKARFLADKALAGLLGKAEALYARPLTTQDFRDICWLYDGLGLPADVILALFAYCQKVGKTAPAYVMEVAKDWWKKEITNHDAVVEWLNRREQAEKDAAMVRRVFGLGARKLTAKESNYIAVWVHEFGFDEEMLKLAYETSVDAIGQLRFAHLHSILNRWHGQGLATPQQVAEDQAAHAKAKEQKKPVQAVASKGKKKSAKPTGLDLQSMQNVFYNDDLPGVKTNG